MESELDKAFDAVAAPVARTPFVPSKYQAAIFEWVEHGTGHAVVEAVAGSGKSTTIIEGLDRMKGKVLFCAFNKHIAEELTSKLASRGIAHVVVSTIHSLGFSAIRKAFGRVEVDGQKLRHIVKDVMGEDMDLTTRRAAEKLASLAKLTLTPAGDRTALQALVDRYEIDVNGDAEGILKAVPEILVECAEETSVIDFDDMVWLPNLLKLKPSRYDWVCIDELQDLNAAQRELVLKAVKPKGRVLGVGDSKQAIYSFAGADTSSIKVFAERLQATTLPLSICYRCPASHIELAKTIVPQIEARENAPKGEIRQANLDEAVRQMEEGDLVICRINKPLAEIAMALIRDKKKAVLRGRDISSSLLNLVEKCERGTGKELHRLIEKLVAYRDKECTKLEKAEKESQAESLRDRVDTIIVLSDGIESVEGLKYRITTIFSDEREGVVCSSVHRAKGLEADRVWIYREELMPHPRAHQEWEIQGEWNLRYVALTRSKNTLVMVAK